MNKKRFIFAFCSVALTLPLFGCTKEKINKEDFEIKETGNLVCGSSISLDLFYKGEKVSDEVNFEITSGKDEVVNDGNRYYFINKEDASITFKASTKFKNEDITLEKTYEVKNDGITLLKDIKTSGVKGDKYTVRGTVIFKKPNKSGYDGFVLADGSDTIYVFDKTNANNVEVGNSIKLEGNFAKYIVSTETSAAEKWNFDGGYQLDKTTIVENDNKNDNSYPMSLVKEGNIYDLSNHSVSDNITSNLYKVKAKIKKVQEPGFFNYYFYDPKESGSMYAYSNYNGEEYNWLASYDDDKYHEAIIMIVNATCTAANSYYRMIPFYVDSSEYVQTTKDKIDGVLIRASDSFNKIFYENKEEVTLDNMLVDANHKDATITYSSSDSKIVDVKDNKLVIKGAIGKANIEIKVSLNNESAEKEVTIEVKKAENLNITSIKDLREKGEDGKEYTIKGVVIDYSWKAKAGNRGVYYIQDESKETILVEPDGTSLKTELNPGELVSFTGTYKFKADKAGGFDGNRALKDAKLENHDSLKHDYYGSFNTLTIEELNSLVPQNDDCVGNIYKTQFKVSKVESAYYTNFYLNSLTDESIKISVYASGESVVSYLNDYVDKKVEGLVAIRDSKKGDKPRFDLLRNTLKIIE